MVWLQTRGRYLIIWDYTRDNIETAAQIWYKEVSKIASNVALLESGFKVSGAKLDFETLWWYFLKAHD